ncbi:MAG: HPr family phosphocarrier protein [Candidatus Omnitrophica bacterium]|nr:HPr family phosphocarrier protein [Candidatus Omnitrophota bacterium]MBI3010434.1 HPr family phosphocarrier protein [Candidatus Omnitrophota bacterium]
MVKQHHQRTVAIVHRQGLHARPAALFVQLAKGFLSKITVKKGRKIVDGKSIMGLLTLAAGPGSRISIITEGPDAPEALDRLAELVTTPLADSSEPQESR